MSQPVSKLQEKLEAREFVFTGEIGPPKGVNIAPVIHEAGQYFKDSVTAVNVTDNQTAVMSLSFAFAAMLSCEARISAWRSPPVRQTATHPPQPRTSTFS